MAEEIKNRIKAIIDLGVISPGSELMEVLAGALSEISDLEETIEDRDDTIWYLESQIFCSDIK